MSQSYRGDGLERAVESALWRSVLLLKWESGSEVSEFAELYKFKPGDRTLKPRQSVATSPAARVSTRLMEYMSFFPPPAEAQ